MIVNRENYVNQLKKKQWNGMIKIITGIRRCGKSTLLLKLFRQYLLDSGVPQKNIISLQLDEDVNEKYRDPAELSKFVRKKIKYNTQFQKKSFGIGMNRYGYTAC